MSALTTELVEKIVDRNCEWYEGGEIDAQAIVDELNAVLGSGNADTDDALALLDEIREAGRISYDDYSQLFDAIAELGSGTCERVTTRNGKFKTKYGRKVPLCECCGYAIGDDRYNFCPKCGAKIVKAVKR